MDMTRGYPDNWKAIALRTKKRYNFTCSRCGLEFKTFWKQINTRKGLRRRLAIAKSRNWKHKWQTLTVHHINRNATDNKPANLIALCSACHNIIEWPLRYAETHRNLELSGQMTLPFNS